MTSKEREPRRMDLVAGLVTSALLSLILIVIVIGAQSGIRVSAQLPADHRLGPYETLTFTFSEAVDASFATQNFSIQPDVKGKFEWSDSRTLNFRPSEPYKPDTTYMLTFTAGPVSGNGGAIRIPRSWKFQVRQPLIVYLVAQQGTGRLWALEKDTGKSTALTPDPMQMLDFDAAHNGEFVVFSAVNEQNGIDLWRVSRSGGDPELLLPCGLDHCSSPAISPDSRRVAYVREAAGPTAALAYGSPRVRILDVETREDSPLYEDQQTIGTRPQWSPNGDYLSSFDSMNDQYLLIELASGRQLTISSQLGNALTWSGDNSALAYTDMEMSDLGLHTRIRQAKVSINDVSTLIGERDDRDYHYNSLAWSPTSNALVIGLRPNPDNPEIALWLMNPDTLDGQSIADEPGHFYSHPVWDPWGKALLFEQFRLKGTYKPEIAFWKPGMQVPEVIAEGMMPHWLP